MIGCSGTGQEGYIFWSDIYFGGVTVKVRVKLLKLGQDPESMHVDTEERRFKDGRWVPQH